MMDDLMTMAELTQWLKTSRQAVYKLVKDGQLPAPLKIGKMIRFDRAAVESAVHGTVAAPDDVLLPSLVEVPPETRSRTGGIGGDLSKLDIELDDDMADPVGARAERLAARLLALAADAGLYNQPASDTVGAALTLVRGMDAEALRFLVLYGLGERLEVVIGTDIELDHAIDYNTVVRTTMPDGRMVYRSWGPQAQEVEHGHHR